jgi:hypothetical protein
MARTVDRWLTSTLLVAAAGLAACGDDNRGEVRTVTETTTEAKQDVPVAGDAILIDTRVTNARRHTGEVLSESLIGEAAFCRGGKTTGGSSGPTITTTFRCSNGRLTVQYAPTQPSLVQGAVWEVVSGTRSYRGLHGGGSMVARFESADPDKGRETFTGTVGK